MPTYDFNAVCCEVLGDHKYVLLVRCEHPAPHYCIVPLGLSGEETLDAAKSRFHDAITVSKMQLATHHARADIGAARIDGLLTPSEQTGHALVKEALKKVS